MITAFTRFVFVAAGLLGGYALTDVINWQDEIGLPKSYVIFIFVILGGSIGFLLGGITGRELTAAWRQVKQRIDDMSGADLVLATVGVIVGLLIAFLAIQPLRLLQPAWLSVAASVLLSVVAAYLSVSVSMTRRREFAALVPALAKPDTETVDERELLLDTSTVIDGRFTEMRRLGFLPGCPRVPRFVLAELQTLADSADDTRRARGRRGLDLLATLPRHEAVDVYEIDYPDTVAVDEKLMRLSAESGGVLVTVDYNLTKVARVRGIDVLNLNEAAAALRPNFLPGDRIVIKIAKPGKEQGQGVGYLEDGTMVVVAEGRPMLGSETQVEVTSVLQTSAGRMIFARLAEEDTSSARLLTADGGGSG